VIAFPAHVPTSVALLPLLWCSYLIFVICFLLFYVLSIRLDTGETLYFFHSPIATICSYQWDILSLQKGDKRRALKYTSVELEKEVPRKIQEL